jgi:uncharacterized protein YdbL (DUF1318 family)
MNRIYKGLTTLALSLALAGTVATAALAAPPTGFTGSPSGSTGDVNAARKALYQSELDHNLATAGEDVNAAREALYQSELAQSLNNRTAAGTQATVEQPDSGRDVNLIAIAVLVLVGGLIAGGAGVVANRRRHRVVAA